jgi:hypothetical protein
MKDHRGLPTPNFYPHGRQAVEYLVREELSIRLPEMTAGYCPELHKRLAALVGEEALVVQ